LLFLSGKAWKWLLVVPDHRHLSVMTVARPTGINYLPGLISGGGQVVIFAQVFAVMSLIGMVYAMHVEDKLQHIMACVYVGGAFGCTFAGDFLTLFIFWELMSIGSTFLIWLARNSGPRGIPLLMYHTTAAVPPDRPAAALQGRGQLRL
jgi:multicomponent Na+:H+ antiporter subunit D